MADLNSTITMLTDTLTKNNLTRIAVKTEGFEIELERNTVQAPATVTATTPAVLVAEKPSGNIVKAPIIGTFYESSAPGKPPFVKVGDSVKKGDVLFIIESMKLMNEVTSDYDGVVSEIFAKNESPLEFDEPVMVIK